MKKFNTQDIQKLIPHRYPFLLIDTIEDYEAGKSIIATKSVSINEWYFQGHFPEHPIMPGVLIVEAMAQAAGCLMKLTLKDEGKDAENTPMYFMRIENATFKQPVHPGAQLKLVAEVAQRRSNVAKFEAKAYAGDTLCTEAKFMAMLAKA